MRVGIDLDGVITDFEQWVLDYGTKFFYENYNREILHPDAFNVVDMFEADEEEEKKFFKEYFKDYIINVPCRPFVGEVLKKMKDKGIELYIITARGANDSPSSIVAKGEGSKFLVTAWLDKNNIYYDKIIFSGEDKVQICLDNNIDIMIEDTPINIKKISEIIKVIAYNTKYNENVNNDNIIRCYSWYDIYAKILDYFKLK